MNKSIMWVKQNPLLSILIVIGIFYFFSNNTNMLSQSIGTGLLASGGISLGIAIMFFVFSLIFPPAAPILWIISGIFLFIGFGGLSSGFFLDALGNFVSSNLIIIGIIVIGIIAFRAIKK